MRADRLQNARINAAVSPTISCLDPHITRKAEICVRSSGAACQGTTALDQKNAHRRAIGREPCETKLRSRCGKSS
jgi:hypothetical protein